MVSTYCISDTVYFISQQYIVLQSNLIDLTKIMFDGQYVLYLQNSIFYLTTMYCFAIQFNWSFKKLCLTLSTYYLLVGQGSYRDPNAGTL